MKGRYSFKGMNIMLGDSLLTRISMAVTECRHAHTGLETLTSMPSKEHISI